MNVTECCTCHHSAMPHGRCLCLCHRSIEAKRCTRCGYLRVQCHCQEPSAEPIADFAAALNPPAGALSDCLPFSLAPTPSKNHGPAETQARLFDTEPTR